MEVKKNPMRVKPRETQKLETQKSQENSEATSLPISDDLKVDKPADTIEATDAKAAGNYTNIYIAVGAVLILGAGWIYKSRMELPPPTKQPKKTPEITKPTEMPKVILPPAKPRKF
jgi:hypothetical protein